MSLSSTNQSVVSGGHACKKMGVKFHQRHEASSSKFLLKIVLEKLIEMPALKALGVIWEAPEDVFRFCLEVPTMEILTECKFLKVMASLYDPLGFVTPFTVKGKALLREMWLINAD